MSQWWASLNGFQQVLWVLATASSVAFLFQLALTLFFGHGDTDVGPGDVGHGDAGHMDSDVEHAHAHAHAHLGGLFTVRNMVAFFLGLSWAGLAFYSIGLGKLFSLVFALAVGIVFVAVSMFIMRALNDLQSNGTVSLARAVGQEGTVALSIPPKMSGQGKVNVVISERMFDLPAMTKGEEGIKRGQLVWVVELLDNRVLVVKEVGGPGGGPYF